MSFSSVQPEDLLFDAARRGDAAYLKHLLDNGTNINIQNGKGFTPLIVAAYDGHLDATKLLLEAGAYVDVQDVSGNTALMGVSFKGYPEIAQLLIEHGADLDVQNGNNGTALMFATLFGRNNLVKLLLDAGADTSIRDRRGLTARFVCFLTYPSSCQPRPTTRLWPEPRRSWSFPPTALRVRPPCPTRQFRNLIAPDPA